MQYSCEIHHPQENCISSLPISSVLEHPGSSKLISIRGQRTLAWVPMVFGNMLQRILSHTYLFEIPWFFWIFLVSMSNFQGVLGGYKSQQATQLINHCQASRMALAALWSSVMVSKIKFDQKQLVFDSEMFLPWHSQQALFEALDLEPLIACFFSEQRHIGEANHIHIYPFQKNIPYMLWTVLNPRGVIIFQVPPSLQLPFGFFEGPKWVTFNLETLGAPGTCNFPKPKNIQHFSPC